MSATAAILQELEQEAATTRRVLERVPSDKLAWKPHEKSMSLGTLAMHVAIVAGLHLRLGGPGHDEVLGRRGLSRREVDRRNPVRPRRGSGEGEEQSGRDRRRRPRQDVVDADAGRQDRHDDAEERARPQHRA